MTDISTVPIGTIETHVGDTFVVGERVGSGASGVVYAATDATDDNRQVAVKFYLVPSQRLMLKGTTAQAFWDTDADEKVYNNERAALQSLDHPGIQQVLGWGWVTDAAAKFQNERDFGVPASDKVDFLVTKFIHGVSITEWFNKLAAVAEKGSSSLRHEVRTKVINALQQIAEALTYLHEVKRHQHSDIRSENILIDSSTERPILIDFGYSQAFNDALLASTPNTRVRPLWLLNAPAELEPELDLLRSESGQVARDQLRRLLFPGLDLYQLGRLLTAFLDSKSFARLITKFDRTFVGVLAKDLTEWTVARSFKTSDLRKELAKLSDGYWSAAAAPHAPLLAPGQPVRKIALAEATFLAPHFVEKIIETRSFRRLQQLKQLSLLDLVYPSAVQTRFDHSLSVYSTAVELAQFLVRSPRFTRLFDTRSVTELLLCALLHDINHFPFLHYYQELKLATGVQNLFEFFIGSVRRDLPEGTPANIAELIADCGLEPTKIITILSGDYSDLTDPRDQVIKSILDSGVDIDKLCYVQADARSTGVPFGAGVDRRTLLAGADILREPQERKGGQEHWHICFEPSALSAVESLLLARYWNFKQIYWHHTNRALGAMVSHVLRSLADAGHLDLEAYVNATMSLTEAAAMDYLDRAHLQAFGAPSILRDLVTRRVGIFKRLLSIKAPWVKEKPRTADEIRRKDLVESLRVLPHEHREIVITKFKDKLSDIFDAKAAALIKENLILLDIPGRPLDEDMGEVYVARVGVGGEAEQVIQSPFIQTLQHEFLSLSRTVRLFIPAAVRDAVGKDEIASVRVHLEEALMASINESKKNSAKTVR